jgi:hypothetical protein
MVGPLSETLGVVAYLVLVISRVCSLSCRVRIAIGVRDCGFEDMMEVLLVVLKLRSSAA